MRVQALLSGSLKQAVPDLAADYRLVQPLRVEIEHEDDGMYVVSDDEFMIYGTGVTVAEATQDYIRALVEYYELVATAAHADSKPYDLDELVRLKRYLYTVP